MKIITHGHRVECVRYSRSFLWKDENGRTNMGGFGFDCDENGKIDIAKMREEKPLAFENYLKCIFNHEDIKDCGTLTHEWHYWEPAVGLCSCGCEVILDSFTNTCEGCNRDYNKSGQELASRSQWGEETGESLDEILRIH